MNWKEFKKAAEKNGVKDDSQIEIVLIRADDLPQDLRTELIHPNKGDFSSVLIFTV